MRKNILMIACSAYMFDSHCMNNANQLTNAAQSAQTQQSVEPQTQSQNKIVKIKGINCSLCGDNNNVLLVNQTGYQLDGGVPLELIFGEKAFEAGMHVAVDNRGMSKRGIRKATLIRDGFPYKSIYISRYETLDRWLRFEKVEIAYALGMYDGQLETYLSQEDMFYWRDRIEIEYAIMLDNGPLTYLSQEEGWRCMNARGYEKPPESMTIKDSLLFNALRGNFVQDADFYTQYLMEKIGNIAWWELFAYNTQWITYANVTIQNQIFEAFKPMLDCGLSEEVKRRMFKTYHDSLWEKLTKKCLLPKTYFDQKLLAENECVSIKSEIDDDIKYAMNEMFHQYGVEQMKKLLNFPDALSEENIDKILKAGSAQQFKKLLGLTQCYDLREILDPESTVTLKDLLMVKNKHIAKHLDLYEDNAMRRVPSVIARDYDFPNKTCWIEFFCINDPGSIYVYYPNFYEEFLNTNILNADLNKKILERIYENINEHKVIFPIYPNISFDSTWKNFCRLQYLYEDEMNIFDGTLEETVLPPSIAAITQVSQNFTWMELTCLRYPSCIFLELVYPSQEFLNTSIRPDVVNWLSENRNIKFNGTWEKFFQIYEPKAALMLGLYEDIIDRLLPDSIAAQEKYKYLTWAGLAYCKLSIDGVCTYEMDIMLDKWYENITDEESENLIKEDYLRFYHPDIAQYLKLYDNCLGDILPDSIICTWKFKYMCTWQNNPDMTRWTWGEYRRTCFTPRKEYKKYLANDSF